MKMIRKRDSIDELREYFETTKGSQDLVDCLLAKDKIKVYNKFNEQKLSSSLDINEQDKELEKLFAEASGRYARNDSKTYSFEEAMEMLDAKNDSYYIKSIDSTLKEILERIVLDQNERHVQKKAQERERIRKRVV